MQCLLQKHLLKKNQKFFVALQLIKKNYFKSTNDKIKTARMLTKCSICDFYFYLDCSFDTHNYKRRIINIHAIFFPPIIS